MLSFMYTIYGSSVRGFGENKMSWKPERNKRFMVNDYYSLLVSSNDFCFPLVKHLEAKNPFLSGILCLDCCFGEMLDN